MVMLTIDCLLKRKQQQTKEEEEQKNAAKSVDGSSIELASLNGVKWVDWVLIRVVDLSRNHLKSVPIELFGLPNIESIDLSENKLESVPALCTCRALALDVSRNELTRLDVGGESWFELRIG